MKNLRLSLACLALLASAAACSDAGPLTAPAAPRFNAGLLVGGNGADTTSTGADGGGVQGSGNSADTGGGVKGSGG